MRGLFSNFDDNFFEVLKLKKRECTDRILPLVKGCINRGSLSSKFVNKESKPEKYAINIGENAPPPSTFP